MKKYYLIIAFFFVALAAINTFYFRSIYEMQINQQKNFLFKQSDVCVDEIEHTLLKFESDLNYILFIDDVASLFGSEESKGLQKLKLFYSTYNSLVKNIDIYDNNKNVLNLFRDRKQNFIADSYLAQRQRKLLEKEDVLIDGDEYQYVLPIFKDNELYANILVTINITNYILSELSKFRLENISWQWAIDRENNAVFNTSDISYNWNGSLESVMENLNKDLEGLLIHSISNDSLEYKILSVYAPVQLLDHDFGIALSVDHNTFLKKVFSKLTVLAIASLLVFLVVSFFLLHQIGQLKKKIKA